MLARYSFAISSGTFMTIALLYVMQMLIGLQPGAATDGTYRPINFLGSIRIVDPPKPPEKKPIKKKDLIDSPVPPSRTLYSGGGEPIGIPSTAQHPPPGVTGIDFGQVNNGSLVNIIRSQPVYPARAQADGLEGYAIVQFDVGANGLVHNVFVVEASHAVFHKPSIKAALRFKFKPRVVDGVAVVTEGIRNKFRYLIDE